jgi:hypothetical protein
VEQDAAKRRDVARTIEAIAKSAALPSPFDTHALMPPTLHAFVRSVPRRNLWLWFLLRADGSIDFVHLSAQPPIPAD